MNRLVFLFSAIFVSCGTQPPLNLEASLPPAPPVVTMQENITYGPSAFFKKGETVLGTTEVILKSLGDVAGLKSTPTGKYDLIIRAYADTIKGKPDPRLIVKLGNVVISTVRISRTINDYIFPSVVGTGDTLRLILGDDFYDPVTKADINIRFTKVTLSFTGSAAQAKLVWDANTESDLAGYNIYYGLSSRVYGSPEGVGLSTSYPLVFKDGKTRYFAVTAFDTAKNESDYSTEVVWTAPKPDTVVVPPKPKVDTTFVNWPDNKPIRMRVVYQKKDATGKPLLPNIRLQMQRFDSLNTYAWLDRLPNGVDYTLTGVNDSTSVIEMRMDLLKAGTSKDGNKYLQKIRFRVRLENPTDTNKNTPWVESNKAILLTVTVNPLEGIPLLPTFRLILE